MRKSLEPFLASADPKQKSNTRSIPVAIDLFCGCGGLTLGLKQAGFKVIGAIDIDPFAVETYRANHTGVKVWREDIVNYLLQR